MSKKHLTQQLAKADCKRCNEGLPSIASEIMNNTNFTKMADIIKKKSKTNEECAYLKTGDAWFKRFSTLTVSQLTSAVETFIHSEITNEETLDTNDMVEIPLNIESKAESKLLDVDDTQSQISINDHRSQVSTAKSTKEDDLRSNISKKRAYSHVSLNIEDPLDTKSVVSQASKSVFDKKSIVSQANDTRSEISVSDRKSVVSLAESSLKSEETESDISSWYEQELQNLQSKTLRDEQYRRKRAMLRVEYWTKLDKIRNNATPTIINF
tara:strand:+ start:348 stop:1151 length:804 start_codon:yes stop_codon:yes gene_type:complete